MSQCIKQFVVEGLTSSYSNSASRSLGNAVVYGSGLDLYTCVETLLVLGVPASWVHLVLTPPGTPPAACCFGDPEVGRAVDRALRRAGVRIHRDCVLARMDTDRTTGRITSLSFSTQGVPLHLPCGVSAAVPRGRHRGRCCCC